MELIVFESEAFYKLIEEVTRPLIDEIKEAYRLLSDRSTENIYMDQEEVMRILHITNKKYFSQYQAKKNLPCYKDGRKYIYKRSEIMSFIENHKVNKSRA